MVVQFISLMDPTKRLCSRTGVTRFGNISARLVSAYDCNRVMAEHCIEKIVNNTVKSFGDPHFSVSFLLAAAQITSNETPVSATRKQYLTPIECPTTGICLLLSHCQ